jgi:hypothetical protein
MATSGKDTGIVISSVAPALLSASTIAVNILGSVIDDSPHVPCTPVQGLRRQAAGRGRPASWPPYRCTGASDPSSGAVGNPQIPHPLSPRQQ